MLPAAFVVALGWFLRVLQRSGIDFGASGVDFGGFLKGPGTVFRVPGVDFSALLRACTLVLGKSFQCVKTIVFPRFLQVFHISRAFCAQGALGRLLVGLGWVLGTFWRPGALQASIFEGSGVCRAGF